MSDANSFWPDSTTTAPAPDDFWPDNPANTSEANDFWPDNPANTSQANDSWPECPVNTSQANDFWPDKPANTSEANNFWPESPGNKPKADKPDSEGTLSITNEKAIHAEPDLSTEQNHNKVNNEPTENETAPKDVTPTDDAANNDMTHDDASKKDIPKDEAAKEEETDKDASGDNEAGSKSGMIDIFDPDFNIHVKLSDLQGDENSPLYSVSKFEELGINDQILQGIYSMNFKKPSKIQEKALPLLLNDPPINMIAQSQSGTGKTAAFVITILSRIDFSMPNLPQALILAPSRELARQIESVVRSLGSFLEGLTIQAAVPGAVERDTPVHAMVVVGTPGTTMDLIRRRQLLTHKIKILCLDEADNMLDMQGLGDQCLRVKNMLPRAIQTILFSATFPDEVWEYAREFSPDAAEITLPKDDLTVSGISQMFIDCPSDEGKYEILAQLYGMMTIGSSIIFVKKRETADRISERLVHDGHTVVAVHGAYDGADRDRILEEFRAGEAKVLITTNVLARGIDVSTVSMVINYDIPMKGRFEDQADPETYLHRIGRTGRFGRTGVSISFVFDRRSFHALSAIAQEFNIDLVRLNHENWDQAEKVIQSIIKTTRLE
ncbi:ATP-dependent RNA helicase [Podosphaera aphanis]|nr:ATP-dependent RNA helicase [Podosphaera aphanis]